LEKGKSQLFLANIFNNNLVETPVKVAYQFNTHSEFIKNMKEHLFINKEQ
jgi:hypothetical protein